MSNTMIRRIIFLLALSLAAAACGDDTSVGDDALFQFDQDQANALGGSTTVPVTEAPATIPQETTTTVAATTETTAAPVATTVPPEQQEVSIEIIVSDDGQGNGPFDPRVAAIRVGGKVRFVNQGTVAHSVVADNGAFSSGEIAPGGVWIYTAEFPGQFNYSDGARPYAVGTIDVVQ